MGIIRIGVCEDEKILRQHCIKYIEAYFKSRQLGCCVDDYEKGEALIKNKHDQYQLLLLDVDLGEMIDGIELAKKLRIQGNTSEIVFLTSHQEEAYRAFEVEAFRYLIKPLKKEALYEVLDKAVEKIKTKQVKKLCFKSGSTILQLSADDIFYIENIGHKQLIHTRNEIYEINNTMKELEKQLQDYDFFRIHKSFLVHMKYIKQHKKDTVIMENEDKLCISRLQITPFKEAVIAYIRRMGCEG